MIFSLRIKSLVFFVFSWRVWPKIRVTLVFLVEQCALIAEMKSWLAFAGKLSKESRNNKIESGSSSSPVYTCHLLHIHAFPLLLSLDPCWPHQAWCYLLQ